MTALVKVFIALVFLTQICVSEDTEFTAFCDVARLVNPETECPATLSCPGDLFYDAVSAGCSGGHIVSFKAQGLSLKSLPESLNAMTYLTQLNIADNELTELPVLKNLTKLQTIYAFSNKLTTITGVFNSPKLASVSIANNALVDLPPEFGETALNTLNIMNNDIEKIPESYKGLTMKSVSLSGNKLDCSEVATTFPGSLFAQNCMQAQQRTEDDYPALPTSWSTEPPNEGLDAYEITSIILACIFVVGAVLAVVFYVRYRRGGIEA